LKDERYKYLELLKEKEEEYNKRELREMKHNATEKKQERFKTNRFDEIDYELNDRV